MTQPDVLVEAARDLREKVSAYRNAHFAAGDHLRALHYVVGLLLIILSAVVSSSVLQASNEDPGQGLTLAVGLLSMAVVVLTSIQTTFRLGERGEMHRSAAVGFGQVGRKLDVFIHRPHPNVDDAWTDLQAITDEITRVEAGAPGYFTRTYRRARRELMQEAASALETSATKSAGGFKEGLSPRRGMRGPP
jgi:hypothetical protein